MVSFDRQAACDLHVDHVDLCLPTEKLFRVMTSNFRPDLNLDTESEKELEVSRSRRFGSFCCGCTFRLTQRLSPRCTC